MEKQTQMAERGGFTPVEFSARFPETTPDVAIEALQSARRHGVITSYDLNYRDSLWASFGGKKQAQIVNRRIAPFVDVILGNEEDFSAALGYEIPGMDESLSNFEVDGFKKMIQTVVKDFPFSVVATTLRKAKTATINDWGAICYCDGRFYEARHRENLEILDRVGGGDSFAAGLIYGFLEGKDPQWAVDCGAAHGALAMTTPAIQPWRPQGSFPVDEGKWRAYRTLE